MKLIMERTTVLTPIEMHLQVKKLPIPLLPTNDEVVILSIDIGKRWGITIYKQKGAKQTFAFYTVTVDCLATVRDIISHLLTQYEPDLIITCYPVRFYNTIVAHSKQLGIIECAAEEHNIAVIELNESHLKKLVFKRKVDKEDVKQRYQLDIQDVNDSLLFLEGYIISVLKP